MASTLIGNPKFAAAEAHFVAACAASRAHSLCAAKALDLYGDHGSLISGCVRDHFPSPIKDFLRTLAQPVTLESDAGYSTRPARVQFATMRKLAREVATRDGSGVYGPQPNRSLPA